MVRGAMLVADADLQFDWLFADEFPAVMRAVYLIVHDLGRAEDITQDAFVQLLRHWKKVSRYDRPGAWVRQVAIRLAVEAARREQVRTLLERNVEPPPIRGPVDVDVMRAVRQLPGMQRAAWCCATSKTFRCRRSPTFCGAQMPPSGCISTGRASGWPSFWGRR